MKEQYHFIGIGGIGMSALARILLAQNKKVSGSDLKETPTTEQLKALGAVIYLQHKAAHIHHGMRVIYSSDVPFDNTEKVEAERLKLPIMHRSELLDELMRGQKPLLITGCHGKTSTTAMLATLLMEGKQDPSFVIGGYVRHLMINGYYGKGEYFVAEADESDGSFLISRGWGAIVTNTDEDHIRYWQSKEHLLNAYKTFIHQTQQQELLFLCAEDPFLWNLALSAQYYGFSPECRLRITRMQQEGLVSEFDLLFEGKRYTQLRMKMQGVHQVLNATAAVGMALKLGVDIESIRHTLLNYSGVKRRLEYIGEVQGIKIFDDYAHHPTEIVATLKALKEAIPQGRIVVVFQPHRYIRLQRYLLQFAQAFDHADICLITEVYGVAEEEPILGVTSQKLIAQMTHPYVVDVHSQELLPTLLTLLQPEDVVLTVGAGDITKYGPLLLNQLKAIYAQ